MRRALSAACTIQSMNLRKAAANSRASASGAWSGMEPGSHLLPYD